jgi:hypothetical protein
MKSFPPAHWDFSSQIHTRFNVLQQGATQIEVWISMPDLQRRHNFTVFGLAMMFPIQPQTLIEIGEISSPITLLAAKFPSQVDHS